MMEAETETVRLVRLLNTLPLEEAVFLARRTAPLSACQRWRLDQRDETIRAATGFLLDLKEGERAERISRDLQRHLASAWRWSRGDAGAVDSYDAAIRRIATLNEGRPIGARQILNVFNHSRGCTYRSS